MHRVFYEALERILVQVYEWLHGCLFDKQGLTTLDLLTKTPCKHNLLECLTSENCNESLERYDKFKETVRQGALGKTAQFWLSYMEKVGLILQFHRATKENCLALQLASLQRMCSMFFCFDHPNYASCILLVEYVEPGKKSIHEEQRICWRIMALVLTDQMFRNAVDITIEQTIDRHTKSHGEIVGFSRNRSVYYRSWRTRHARASYLQATKKIANIDTLEST